MCILKVVFIDFQRVRQVTKKEHDITHKRKKKLIYIYLKKGKMGEKTRHNVYIIMYMKGKYRIIA